MKSKKERNWRLCWDYSELASLFLVLWLAPIHPALAKDHLYPLHFLTASTLAWPLQQLLRVMQPHVTPLLSWLALLAFAIVGGIHGFWFYELLQFSAAALVATIREQIRVTPPKRYYIQTQNVGVMNFYGTSKMSLQYTLHPRKSTQQARQFHRPPKEGLPVQATPREG